MEAPTRTDLRVVDPEQLEWIATSPGIRKRVLHDDPMTGAHTLLVEFQPGAATSKLGPHPNGEEIYVIRGTFLDGDRRCPAGTFLHYAPGSAHQPRSDEGCLCLITVPGPGNFSG
jgi:anti-sigma factor ChrR (cupin superfamily)